MPRRQAREKRPKPAEPAKPEAVFEDGVLRVGTGSDPNRVAGAIAGCIREDRQAVVQTIGAGALNQAVKAIAIARGYLSPGGLDIWCYPAFIDVEIDGAERTAIRFFIEPREPSMRGSVVPAKG